MRKLDLLAPTENEKPEPLPQTWENDVFVPLVQNLLGGLATAGLGFVGTVAIAEWQRWSIDPVGAGMWCALVGGSVAFGFTVLRYFGDDLGLLRAAYRLGWHHRDGEVNALHAELESLKRTLASLQGDQPTSTNANATTERMERAYRHAKELLEIGYNGGNTARASDDHGIGQQDWRRAKQLLEAAGILANGQFTERTLGLAIRRLDGLYHSQIEKAGESRAYKPAWLL